MLAIVLISISIKGVEVHASFKQEQNLVSKIQKKQRETKKIHDENQKPISKQATDSFISSENTKENKDDNTQVKRDLEEKKNSPKKAIRKDTSKAAKKVSRITKTEESVMDSSTDAKTQVTEEPELTEQTSDSLEVPAVTTTSQSQQYEETNDSDFIDGQNETGEQPIEEPETIESEEVETTDTDSKINSKTNKQVIDKNSGFCFLGYSFPLDTFEGSGSVPHWTPYVYQWADDPSHFLFERQSDAGQAVLNLNIGDQVVVNGKNYSIFDIEANVPNDENTYEVIQEKQAKITWQTCDGTGEVSTLRIYFAE